MLKISAITSKLSTWSWNPEKKFLEFRDKSANKTLGVIQMVSIRSEESQEIYQQPWWLESRGEIDIIATPDKKIVFVHIERHSVIPPEAYRDSWGERPPNPFEHRSGVTEYELPRGFSASYKIEAEEETMYEVEYISTIGHVNGNTSFFGTSPLIAVYKALPQKSGKAPDSSERIRTVELFSPQEVAHLETLCGFTKASLWEFCQWALVKQDDVFWKDIAKSIVNEWVEKSESVRVS